MNNDTKIYLLITILSIILLYFIIKNYDLIEE